MKPQNNSSDISWEMEEVRYPLDALLREVAAERRTGFFGKEKLHQDDIDRLYTNTTEAKKEE
tara:strand:- start:157 stop:342 length:186 start_codon:yes stop_codon:yes gene_type:complete